MACHVASIATVVGFSPVTPTASSVTTAAKPVSSPLIPQFHFQVNLDALVSITSDEDLAHLLEEYDLVASAAAASPPSFKIRAFLSAPQTIKRVSRPSSSASHYISHFSSLKSLFCFSGGCVPPRCPVLATRRFTKRSSRPPTHSTISDVARHVCVPACHVTTHRSEVKNMYRFVAQVKYGDDTSAIATLTISKTLFPLCQRRKGMRERNSTATR
ncbi:hypothetical protein ACS0TY_001737 [Phlomoides rotata]